MKQIFPTLVAILATTIVLVYIMQKDQRRWPELEKKEKQTRLALVAAAGLILLAVVAVALR